MQQLHADDTPLLASTTTPPLLLAHNHARHANVLWLVDDALPAQDAPLAPNHDSDAPPSQPMSVVATPPDARAADDATAPPVWMHELFHVPGDCARSCCFFSTAAARCAGGLLVGRALHVFDVPTDFGAGPVAAAATSVLPSVVAVAALGRSDAYGGFPRFATVEADDAISLWLLLDGCCPLRLYRLADPQVRELTVARAAGGDAAALGSASAQWDTPVARPSFGHASAEIQMVTQPSTDPLVGACLRRLSVVLPMAHYGALLTAMHEGRPPSDIGGGNLSDHVSPWERFAMAFCSWARILPDGVASRAAVAPATAAARSGDWWQALLASPMHARLGGRAPMNGLRPAETNARPLVPAAVPPSEVVASAIATLCALCEDLRLSTLAWPTLGSLETLLDCFAAGATAVGVAHSRRALPCDFSTWGRGGVSAAGVAARAEQAEAVVRARGKTTYGEALRGDEWLCSTVLRLHAMAEAHSIGAGGVASATTTSLAEVLVLAMAAVSLRPAHVDVLPAGIALPLIDSIRLCRRLSRLEWPLEAYRLIGRNDLARHRQLPRRAAAVVPPAPSRASAGRPPPGGDGGAATVGGEDDDPDGMIALVAQSMLRFSRDLRMEEVRRLLCSSRPVAFGVAGGADIGGDSVERDPAHEQQARLALLCRRTMALPIGRGMFTLASAPAVLSEALRLAPISLQGQLSPSAATVELDASSLPTEHLKWPEFHNGCAAALRLAPPGCGHAEQGELGRHWIMYNKPRAQPHAHAGFLLGLGLQGHLVALANTDVYRYMSQGHEVTMMAVLLGMSAARRCTMHRAIAKMLCLHVPALHPPSFTELELQVPALVQVAALLGIGLLYQGSAHRLMAEVLLGEIARPPTNELLSCRESYALSAGIALGMLALGKGTDTGLADLHIDDRLVTYMHGDGAAAATWQSGGGRAAPGRAPATPRKGAPSATQASVAGRCYRIREGLHVNLDVTAAGATIALGLIYLKSNSAAAAARLRVPRNMYELNCVRPDLVLLRVLSRNLILWDAMRPTQAWLDGQVVAIGSADDAADHAADVMQTLRLARVNSISGACLALGIRFAGSCSAAACELIRAKTLELSALRAASAKAAVGLDAHDSGEPSRAEQPALETCVGTCAIALACVMAGSGNLGCLRVLRVLRKRVDAEVSHGYHMAISMAIGLLFLGGGRLTLGTSNEAVAALVTAAFPRFPSSPTDNRYHLQALRHLYVLAAEARCLEAVDVDSGEAAMVPLTIALRGGKVAPMRKVTPCILPPISTIESITLESPRYCSVKLLVAKRPEHAMVLRQRTLWIKRTTGHLSYWIDPRGLASIFCRPLGGVGSGLGGLLRAFCKEPALLAYARHLCEPPRRAPRSAALSTTPELALFCERALFHCLGHGKPDMLYMHLRAFVACMRLGSAHSSVEAQSLLLLATYNSSVVVREGAAFGGGASAAHSGDDAPLQTAFVHLVFERLRQHSGAPTLASTCHGVANPLLQRCVFDPVTSVAAANSALTAALQSNDEELLPFIWLSLAKRDGGMRVV